MSKKHLLNHHKGKQVVCAKEGTAENSRTAYQADIQYYQEQGGQLPATLESIITQSKIPKANYHSTQSVAHI